MALTPQSNASLEDIARVVRDNDRFVLCGHVSPDGDCLGSQLALWHALVEMGKTATCVLVHDDPPPAELAFLPGMDAFVPAEKFDGEADVFMGLDVPTRERVGTAACSILDACSVSITIDHHAVESTMCQYVYVDPDSASASVLIWELVKLLREAPSKESALCAYVGLMTDTGGFRFQNSDARAFLAAAEMVAQGADPALAATNVYQCRTIASLQLERLAIERMILGSSGRFALSWVTRDDMESFGAEKSDTEELVDVLRSIDCVQVVCMLREQDGAVRGSLRAKGDGDVGTLARELGGGGHRAAAGFSLDMPIEEAVAYLSGKLSDLVSDTDGR